MKPGHASGRGRTMLLKSKPWNRLFINATDGPGAGAHTNAQSA